MDRKVYKQIARKYGVSVAEVRRDMQAAINEAYENPNAAALAVPKKGAIPTPEEFISHIAGKVRTERDSGE
jgi:hypothetical protein